MPSELASAHIEKRRPGGFFQEIWSHSLVQYDLPRLSAASAHVRTAALFVNGPPDRKVDVAIVGDGYAENEFDKFEADAARAATDLFSVAPFAQRAQDFNVRTVFVPSRESGVADDHLGIRRESAFRTRYFGGRRERTLAVTAPHALGEAASAVPYDYLLVIANARRYGGSAHFGGPAVAAIDSAAARYLVLHEFAHAMAGLADEYYIPYRGGPVYAGNVEPWPANVTLSPAGGKWGAPPRPSAWNKVEYDRYFAHYVARYERLRARGAAESEIERFMQSEREKQSALLAQNRPLREVGFYEGANGYARGTYRSEVDCIMFSLQSRYFCNACTAAIERAIDAHCL